MSNNSSVLGLLAGTAIGAVLGVLFAPDKGSVTRQKIVDEANATKDMLSESAYDFKDRVVSTVVAKKATLDEKVESIVSDASYKAEDVITTLENKLSELKLKNKKLQRSTPNGTETV